MTEAIVVAYMFSFVASVLNTSVGVVVMSQIICIAPSPCLVVPPSYLLRIITSSSLQLLTLVLKQQRKTSTLQE